MLSFIDAFFARWQDIREAQEKTAGEAAPDWPAQLDKAEYRRGFTRLRLKRNEKARGF